MNDEFANVGKGARSKLPLFAPDDYEEINSRYFEDVLRDQSWVALPAGWHNPYSAAAEAFSPQSPSHEDVIKYALDEGHSLGELKEAALDLLGNWEATRLSWDEVTLCPSVSTANLLTLTALKARGVRTIVIETPAYYATPSQAELLGLEVRRIPCHLADDFQIPGALFAQSLPATPCALWMTQPRFGIGTNQDIQRLRKLASLLRPTDVLVFDEAAEQMFPSVLSQLGDVGCDVIRTRGIVKGLGLNGLRTAVVIHPPTWRPLVEQVLEVAGASLDRFSLRAIRTLAASPQLMPALLKVANEQVLRMRRRLDVLTAGTWATPTALCNGYIGSVILDLHALPGSYQRKREAFLDFCRDRRMPVVLRASIGFPHDDDWEAVRMNYFTSSENVETAAGVLVDAFEALRGR